MTAPGALTILEAYFNAMLREFGVTGLKVQEVISLEEQFLAYHAQVSKGRFARVVLMSCSRPIHGLIFLFKWREEDPDKLEQSCPEGVWFANQVHCGLAISGLEY